MSSPKLSMAIVMIALTTLTPMASQPKTVQKDSPNARDDCWGADSASARAILEIPDCSEMKWSVKWGLEMKGTPQQKCCSRMNTHCARIAFEVDLCKRVYTKNERKDKRNAILEECKKLGVTWTERLCDTGSGPITDDTSDKCPKYMKYLDCKDIDVSVDTDSDSTSGGLPLRLAANALFVVSTLIVSFFYLSLILSHYLTNK